MTTSSQPPPSPSPRLAIGHFLLWIAGIAVALWLQFGGSPPKPENTAGVVLICSRGVYAIAMGGGIAFLAWSTLRLLRRKDLLLSDPGVRYLVLWSGISFFTVVAMLCEYSMAGYSESDDTLDWWFRWHSILELALGILKLSILSFGIYWIGGVGWRLALMLEWIVAAMSVSYLLILFDVISPQPIIPGFLFATWHWIAFAHRYVGLIAILGACLFDWKNKVPRSWLHYFGVTIYLLHVLEFTTTQAALALLRLSR